MADAAAGGRAGAGLGGLPLTGGALAKFAVKDLMGDGLVATLAGLSSPPPRC